MGSAEQEQQTRGRVDRPVTHLVFLFTEGITSRDCSAASCSAEHCLARRFSRSSRYSLAIFSRSTPSRVSVRCLDRWSSGSTRCCSRPMPCSCLTRLVTDGLAILNRSLSSDTVNCACWSKAESRRYWDCPSAVSDSARPTCLSSARAFRSRFCNGKRDMES